MNKNILDKVKTLNKKCERISSSELSAFIQDLDYYLNNIGLFEKITFTKISANLIHVKVLCRLKSKFQLNYAIEEIEKVWNENLKFRGESGLQLIIEEHTSTYNFYTSSEDSFVAGKIIIE